MKQKLIILFVVLLVFSVSACAQTTAPSNSRALTAARIVDRLKEKGLPVSNIVVYTEDSDPYALLGKPNQYVSKAGFSDPDHPDEAGTPFNSVEVFATAADAKARAESANSVTCSVCIQAKYVYQHETHVLLLHPDITLENAARYEAAFLSAVG